MRVSELLSIAAHRTVGSLHKYSTYLTVYEDEYRMWENVPYQKEKILKMTLARMRIRSPGVYFANSADLSQFRKRHVIMFTLRRDTVRVR